MPETPKFNVGDIIIPNEVPTCHVRNVRTVRVGTPDTRGLIVIEINGRYVLVRPEDYKLAPRTVRQIVADLDVAATCGASTGQFSTLIKELVEALDGQND